MKQILKIVGSLLILLLFGSCSNEQSTRQTEWRLWIQNNGKIKVLSTTAMIDDLVKSIGGDQVDTLTLIYGQLDPHSYQLVKGDDEKLSFAQIIFANGVGLEHGPSLHSYLAKNPKTISLGDKIEKSDPNSIIFVRGQRDPHIWTDISLWARTIPFIVEALSAKDPAHAKEFQERGDKLNQELLKAHAEVREIVQAIPEKRRYLVTSHDAFNYFTRAYMSQDSEIADHSWGKRFEAPEGLAPESQLSTTDIRHIIQHLQRYDIRWIFPESNVSRDSINKIVQAGKEKGLEIEIICCPLYADAMGPEGSEGDTYLKMMIYNAKMISRYLKPEQEVRSRESEVSR